MGVAEGDGAKAVKFDFVDPVAGGRGIDEEGFHGFDESARGFGAGTGGGARSFFRGCCVAALSERAPYRRGRAIFGGAGGFGDGGFEGFGFLAVGLPDAAGAAGELLHGFAGEDGGVVLFFGYGLHVLAALDEEPFVAAAELDEIPFAAEFFSGEDEVEFPFFEIFGGGVGEGFERAAVPDHDGAAAVLALGDGAFEIDVGDGMILDVDGEAAVAFFVGHALRHGPGFEGAADFEAEVVVEAGGGVFLDDETMAGAGAAWGATAFGFGGFREISLTDVFLERHGARGLSRRGGRGFRGGEPGSAVGAPRLHQATSVGSAMREGQEVPSNQVPSTKVVVGISGMPRLFCWSWPARISTARPPTVW